MQVKEFQTSCLKDDSDIVVQKYLIDGSCYFFDTFFKETKEEFHFKKDLSISLDVHLRDIVIIGSGKLGFSIKPDKDEPSLYQYKAFDFNYNQDVREKKSDLDIAIVSSSLFDKQLLSIYNHTGSYSSTNFIGKQKKSFAFYILKGWLKPEFIPSDYAITPEINYVSQRYQAKYGREINIGIYKSWYFFEDYHKNNIKTININLLANS